jgi:hypothetical protein
MEESRKEKWEKNDNHEKQSDLKLLRKKEPTKRRLLVEPIMRYGPEGEAEQKQAVVAASVQHITMREICE